MPISGRHVRHDWQTFVDSEQLSVRTVCRKTASRHMAGIPGVTQQETFWRDDKDRVHSGWCIPCAHEVYRVAFCLRDTNLHPYIHAMYLDVLDRTVMAYNTWLARQQKVR